MHNWHVILLSAAALLFLSGGLLVLALPDPYEGPLLYQISPQHAIRRLDAVGVLLLLLGNGLAWGAGLAWRRRVCA